MNLLYLLTALATGLTAGTFFAWTVSVVPGLARLTDLEYLGAMQSLNREIQNPWFFCCFFGALLLLPVSAWATFEGTTSIRFWLLLGAALLYFLGVLGITAVGNVPLNNALDSVQLQMLSPAQLASQRLNFESLWNNLNTIRTVAAVLSFSMVLAAVLKPR